MKRLFYIFSFGAFVTIAYLLFKTSYKANEVKNEIILIQRKINKDKEDIRILQAEWTYLSSPKRIRELAEKHLNVKLQSGHQIKKNEEVLVFNDRKEKK